MGLVDVPVERTEDVLETLREADRLATLRAYDVLDTESEEAFDELTCLAATICETPIALVSLVDECRQWFKSKVGLDAAETPRDVAFCAHAIREPEDLFVVPDTLEDERFAENPLVTDGPRIRFYAGAPLAAPNGLALGTLCVIDGKPRDLSESQLEALRVLGRQVIAQLELRRSVAALRLREREFRDLFENSPVGMYRMSSEGRVTTANPALLRMIGAASVAELEGEEPEATPERASFAAELERSGEVYGFETIWRRCDGAPLHVSESARTVRTMSGEISHTDGAVEDISERRHAQTMLADANRRLRDRAVELERRGEEMNALRSMSELVQRCESSEEAYDVFRRFAPALFADATGALFVGVAGPRLERALAWGDDDATTEAIGVESCWALRRGRVHRAGHDSMMPPCEHANVDGAATTVCVPLLARGETPGVLTVTLAGSRRDQHRIGVIESLAAAAGEQLALLLANLDLRASLREQAIRDPLTGLFNRRYMEETLLREVRRAERRKTKLCVVMLDVDNFKKFNDAYGHDAGDAVLREVGSLLGGSIRAVDVACRYGGEEFTLILPDASAEDVRAKIERILELARLRETRHDGWVLPPTTLSAGVASFPECGGDGETLLRAADAALYQAKYAGRDRVIVAEAGR